MALRIVQQPNGLFARFSDVVNKFTRLNMTTTEALSLCKTVKEAINKVFVASVNSAGWEECINIIKNVYGNAAAQDIINKVGLPDDKQNKSDNPTPPSKEDIAQVKAQPAKRTVRNLDQIAHEALRCALSWEPAVCLLGNVMACEIVLLALSVIELCPKCGSKAGCNNDCDLCLHVQALKEGKIQ